MLTQNTLIGQKCKSLKGLVNRGVIDKSKALEIFYDWLLQQGFCSKNEYCKDQAMLAKIRYNSFIKGS